MQDAPFGFVFCQKHSTTGASACPFYVSDFILQLTSEIYLPTVINDMNRSDLTGTTAAKVRTLRILFSFINLEPREILELGKDAMVDSYGNLLPNPTEEQFKDFSALLLILISI